MFTQAEFQARVGGLEAEYKQQVPLSFWEEIVHEWFQAIFPVRNEQYGVEGLQRLGPTACVAEFIGCYYRWARMRSNDYSITNRSMRDSVMDAFGYSVLMRALADTPVTWDQGVKSWAPAKDAKMLLDLYWEDLHPVDMAAVTMATRCSINMYKRTSGA